MTTARLTRAQRSAQTRSELLAAAERLFLSRGYHATTLDDIADEAGYTKGAVYSAFGSKAGLFLDLFDVVVERRLAEVRALVEPARTAATLLEALAARPVPERDGQFVLLAIEFWVHAAREPALLEAFSERYRRLRASLAELAPPGNALGDERWAMATLALSNGLALERLVDPRGVPPDLMASVQAQLLRP